MNQRKLITWVSIIFILAIGLTSLLWYLFDHKTITKIVTEPPKTEVVTTVLTKNVTTALPAVTETKIVPTTITTTRLYPYDVTTTVTTTEPRYITTTQPFYVVTTQVITTTLPPITQIVTTTIPVTTTEITTTTITPTCTPTHICH